LNIDHAAGVAPRHHVEAVVLDPVKPPGPLGGWSAGDGRQGWMKPEGGRRVRNIISPR
jgi:hypothetical protein